MTQVNAIDIAPYGASGYAEVTDGIAYANCAYRHKCGLGIGAAASGLFGWTPITASISVKNMDMACGTHHHVLVLHLALLLFGCTVTLSFTRGKRDEELVAKIRAARDAIIAESDLFGDVPFVDRLVDDNFGSIKS